MKYLAVDSQTEHDLKLIRYFVSTHARTRQEFMYQSVLANLICKLEELPNK